MLYKELVRFEFVDEILNCDHSNEATEQYFHVVLFIAMYKVILTLESEDEIPKWKHSITSNRGALWCCLFRSENC